MLWMVMEIVHGNLASGKKATQREIWYRLKPTGLFSNPASVSNAVLDVCSVVSAQCGAEWPMKPGEQPWPQ